MALSNAPKTDTVNTPAPGKFEEPEGSDTAVAEETAAAPAPAAQPSVSKDVIVAKANAVSTSRIRKDTVIRSLENVIEPSALENLGIGTFPRITIGLDGFSIDKEKELGKKIKINVLSHNKLTLVTAGEQNDAEANKLVRTSYDGVNLTKGEGLVTDYVAHLKAEGYENASAKGYIEVYCQIMWSQEGGEIAPEDYKIHQLSLSPQSAGKFQAYLLEAGVRKSMGIDDSPVCFVTQERRIVGNNKFGVGVWSTR